MGVKVKEFLGLRIPENALREEERRDEEALERLDGFCRVTKEGFLPLLGEGIPVVRGKLGRRGVPSDMLE